MSAFQHWFAASPLASALRTFIAVVVSMAVAEWVATGNISLGSWEVWVIAALASAVPTFLRWINPADSAFGAGKPEKKSDRFNVFEEK